MRTSARYALCVGAVALFAGYGGRQIDGSPVRTQTVHIRARQATRLQTSLAHIVIIVQENRSVDNLFQLLPNADTQSWGLNSYARRIGRSRH